MKAFDSKCQIAALQAILGCKVDGKWGPETQAAVDELSDYKPSTQPLPSDDPVMHSTYASSFADPADVAAFNKCKAQGKSDEECFKVGDNGVGAWGQSTVEGTGPSCALPPEYMEQRWGSTDAAKNKLVKIGRESFGTHFEVIAVLKDKMPHLKNLANQAHIDLNPDACNALGLEPPVMASVVWAWAADLEQNQKT